MNNWSFLTGYEYEMKGLSVNSFRSEVQGNSCFYQITHGFLLVNPDEEVIKNYYYGIDMNEVKTIVDDLKKVIFH